MKIHKNRRNRASGESKERGGGEREESRFSFRPLSGYTIQEPIMGVILSVADSFAPRCIRAATDSRTVTFVHRYVIAFR